MILKQIISSVTIARVNDCKSSNHVLRDVHRFVNIATIMPNGSALFLGTHNLNDQLSEMRSNDRIQICCFADGATRR